MRKNTKINPSSYKMWDALSMIWYKIDRFHIVLDKLETQIGDFEWFKIPNIKKEINENLDKFLLCYEIYNNDCVTFLYIYFKI